MFLELPPEEYEFEDSKVSIKACGMLPVHFVSRKTEHQLVEGFSPVLTSGNIGLYGEWKAQLAVGEKEMGEGLIRICQVKLSGRTSTNPAVFSFEQRLIYGG